MKTLTIHTENARTVVDITDKVEGVVHSSSFERGLCFLFLVHTTAALTTADLDPGTDLDMLDAFEALIPAHDVGEARPSGRPKLRYRHPHDPSHVPSHILSSLIGTSLTLPIEGGKLVLGDWQRVVLFEFDGPRRREIKILFSEET